MYCSVTKAENVPGTANTEEKNYTFSTAWIFTGRRDGRLRDSPSCKRDQQKNNQPVGCWACTSHFFVAVISWPSTGICLSVHLPSLALTHSLSPPAMEISWLGAFNNFISVAILKQPVWQPWETNTFHLLHEPPCQGAPDHDRDNLSQVLCASFKVSNANKQSWESLRGRG